VRVIRSSLRRRLPDQRLEFAGIVHLGDDVAAADQLALDPELREGGPIGVSRQVGADVRVAQHVYVGEALPAAHQALHRLSGKPALRCAGRTLHVEQDRIVLDLLTDGCHDVVGSVLI